MLRIQSIMATTHVDRHNERVSLAALESMREQIRNSFLPCDVNHDPRFAPFGRVIDAEITDLPDGEHALEGEIEIFESGPLPPLRTDRSMHFRELPRDSLVLTIDRSFSRPEFQDAVAAIAQELGTPVQRVAKKAFEPIAVLIISASSLALGNFAKSFFSRLGETAADLVAQKLKEMFSPRQTRDDVPLLRFEFEFEHEGVSRRAEVILTDPSGEDIDSFLKNGLERLDRVLPLCLGDAEGLVNYVFSYSQGDLTFSFAVRSDAVPLFPEPEVKNQEER